MPPLPTRQDMYSVHVSIAGVSYGVWDKMTGGALDSEEVKYYPGGMVPPESLGGRRTTDNVVVTRNYRLDRDQPRLADMRAQVGKGVCVVSKQSLDADGNAFGPPDVYRGTLKRVTPPEHDSESTAAGMIEIEVTVEGYPSS